MGKTREFFMNKLFRNILGKFGYKIQYTYDSKIWDYKYDDIDYAMGRPIHYNMSVAPPWAKRIFKRTK